MTLGSYEGNFKYETKEEIAEHIRRSSELPMDDIWISGENELPCLAILVNGAYACIHYFDKEGEWISHGTDQKKIIFLAGLERWEAPSDAVVFLEVAISCMEEFFDTMKKPRCIEWQKL